MKRVWLLLPSIFEHFTNHKQTYLPHLFKGMMVLSMLHTQERLSYMSEGNESVGFKPGMQPGSPEAQSDV